MSIMYSVRRWTMVGFALALLGVAGCGDDDVEIPPPERGEPRVAWGEPGGEPAGVVMLLHGGGWQPNPNGFDADRQRAENLQEQGYATVVIGYDEGATGLRQVQDVYAEARERYPDLPICASGTSAGGHLALMLAARESDLACVINFVGPVDLTTLAKQDESGREAYDRAVEAFGKQNLARFSPVRYADQIEAEVLTILAETDPTIPVEQGAELKRALPDAELLLLPAGDEPVIWAHGGGVQPDAQTVVATRIAEFLEEATQGS